MLCIFCLVVTLGHQLIPTPLFIGILPSDRQNGLEAGARRDEDVAISPRRARDETMRTLIDEY